MEAGGQGGGYLPPEPAGPEPDLGRASRPQPEQPPPAQPAWQPPQQGGWQPPQQGGWQPQPWAHQAPPEPDNGAAVAGFVTSVASGALLLMSFGFLSVLTMIAAPFGIHYSRKGKQAVAEGRTRKHAGLAQAGFVIGIVTLVLSVIGVAITIALIVAIATDDEFRRDLQDRNDGRGFDSAAATVVIAVARVAFVMLGGPSRLA